MDINGQEKEGGRHLGIERTYVEFFSGQLETVSNQDRVEIPKWVGTGDNEVSNGERRKNGPGRKMSHVSAFTYSIYIYSRRIWQ